MLLDLIEVADDDLEHQLTEGEDHDEERVDWFVRQ
jgi:hypothetical protein